jgi:hypothetical protein
MKVEDEELVPIALNGLSSLGTHLFVDDVLVRRFPTLIIFGMI